MVSKAHKNPNFINELISERDRKQQQREEIAEVVAEMNKRNQFIDSVAYVQKELELVTAGPPKAHLIRSVLKKDLGMTFKKVNGIAWTANSHRNLILRQQFALAFLEIDLEKKLVLNVDESWCGMSDWRRMKWCQHRHNNSVAQLQIAPRISMITALCSNGEAYISLVQSNTNASIMRLYFHHLIKLLDEKVPKWRSTYVVMLDNASYHRATETLEYLEEK